MAAPLRPAVFALTLASWAGCGPAQAPWVEYGPSRPEETLQAMAVEVVLSQEAQWAPSGPRKAICIGAGRRVEVGLSSRSRQETWDPDVTFFRTLGAEGWLVYPLSACDWDDNVAERVEDTGAPAAAFGVSEVSWVSDRIATLTVNIRENPQRRHRYTCEFRRPGAEWVPERCVYRRLAGP